MISHAIRMLPADSCRTGLSAAVRRTPSWICLRLGPGGRRLGRRCLRGGRRLDVVRRTGRRGRRRVGIGVGRVGYQDRSGGTRLRLGGIRGLGGSFGRYRFGFRVVRGTGVRAGRSLRQRILRGPDGGRGSPRRGARDAIRSSGADPGDLRKVRRLGPRHALAEHVVLGLPCLLVLVASAGRHP